MKPFSCTGTIARIALDILDRGTSQLSTPYRFCNPDIGEVPNITRNSSSDQRLVINNCQIVNTDTLIRTFGDTNTVGKNFERVQKYSSS